MKKAIVMFVIGVIMIVVGNNMRIAQNRWTERVTDSTTNSGTKLRNAGIGAGVGAGTGFIAGLIVGGIGIATGGTAFAVGIPALMVIGAGGGAITGASIGKSPLTTTTVHDVVYVAPLYETWMWVVVQCR